MLERLRAAEEEATRLREQLAKQEATKQEATTQVSLEERGVAVLASLCGAVGTPRKPQWVAWPVPFFPHYFGAYKSYCIPRYIQIILHCNC